ncbi:MAG: hypothetical protein WBE26_19060, partial [Phycisphaerae bacterium]
MKLSPHEYGGTRKMRIHWLSFCVTAVVLGWVAMAEGQTSSCQVIGGIDQEFPSQTPDRYRGNVYQILEYDT